MIISHKYKFIFVKTYKTAGTSLEVCVSQYCGERDTITDIYPPVAGHRPRNNIDFFNHMSATEIQSRVDKTLWDSYFKFCVDRNPWDKVLSFFWMERARVDGSLDLNEFLARKQIGFNWPLYTDKDGERPIVDKVLMYEDLNAELKQTFERLAVPWSGVLDVKAKSEYRKDTRNYREVLTPEQAEYIAKRFQKEIEWHGYQY